MACGNGRSQRPLLRGDVDWLCSCVLVWPAQRRNGPSFAYGLAGPLEAYRTMRLAPRLAGVSRVLVTMAGWLVHPRDDALD